MNTDKELLELAAKAAGLIPWIEDGWNPLNDNGEALCLSVKLNIRVEPDYVDKRVSANYSFEDWDSDQYAATRRAIVRAAAEIGKAIT